MSFPNSDWLGLRHQAQRLDHPLPVTLPESTVRSLVDAAFGEWSS